MTVFFRIPHAPLSDAEWQAILPHLPLDITRGRPCDLRAHFNAIFRLAATDGPWRELPECYGKHDTIARHFRRLTHAGLWERLLIALSTAPADHPLRRLEGLICRAARRAIRIRGLRLITLIRRLNLKRALPAPALVGRRSHFVRKALFSSVSGAFAGHPAPKGARNRLAPRPAALPRHRRRAPMDPAGPQGILAMSPGHPCHDMGNSSFGHTAACFRWSNPASVPYGAGGSEDSSAWAIPGPDCQFERSLPR